MTSSISPRDGAPFDRTLPTIISETIEAPGLPAGHPAEAGLYSRHRDVPGHDQEKLGASRVMVVGAGGLGGVASLCLVRAGVGELISVEHDTVERSNLSRQLFYANDLGALKAHALVRNLTPHAVGGGLLRGIALPFQRVLEEYPDLRYDALMVLVDNNACRFAAARVGRQKRVPVIYAMLSRDGMRLHVFLQGSQPNAPCLRCALPNLEPTEALPCAAGIITSCMVAAGLAVNFTIRALVGWPAGTFHNWREADLLGVAPDRAGVIERRPDCDICS